MRGRRLGAGIAALVVALIVTTGAAAFASDPSTSTTTSTTIAPAGTTPLSTTPPSTTAPSSDAPATDPPATEAPTTTTEPSPPSSSTTTTTVPATDTPATEATPGVTVTPSTNLVNLQSVTVAGTGFTAKSSVGWAECKNNNSGSSDDCDLNHTGFSPTDASGAFSAPFTVRRILHTNNGDVDCASAPDTCTLAAGNVSKPTTEHASTTLQFDPSAPLPPPPTLLAGPLDNLVEGDSVALFGGGFVPNGPVAIVECSQPTVSTCQTLSTVTANASGGFITTVQVHRVLVNPPFVVADCAAAPGTCQLRAVSLADYDFEAHVLLSFDPSGPLPSAAVTVSPDTGLLNFQSVTVSGTGFPASTGGVDPGGFVQIALCKTGATSYEDCSPSTIGFAIVSATGTFSTSVAVRRILHLAGGDFDCASAPDACSLVSSAYGSPPVAVATPISFDDSVPPPLPPAISVTPSTGLVQGQSVTVSGHDFQPNSFVTIGECTTATMSSGFCSGGGIGSFTTTDANGAFSTSFAVRRGVVDFGSSAPGIVDCASAPQTCSIVATGGSGGEDHAAQAIDFDPSAPLTVPDVSLSPQFDLPDRQVVRVHTAGLRPGEHVIISQCPAGAPSFAGICTSAPGPINVLTADGNGDIDSTLRVFRNLTTEDGVVILFSETNCAQSVGACVIRVQSIDDPLVRRDVPIGFDATAVAPPPQLTVTPSGPVTDGQQVQVHGTGFTPNAVLGMAQCQSGVEPNGKTCDAALFTQFSADGDGAFTRTVTLHTHVSGDAGPIDCSGAGSCVLFAANRADYGAERVGVPITFDAGSSTTTTTTPPPVVEPAPVTGKLAFTGAGSSTRPLVAAGFGLLLLGGALVLLARRRRA